MVCGTPDPKNYIEITEQCWIAFYLMGTPPKRCFRLSFLVEKVGEREPIRLGSIYVAVLAQKGQFFDKSGFFKEV